MIRFMRARFLVLAICVLPCVAQAQVPDSYCETASAPNCQPCKIFQDLVSLGLLNSLDADLKAFILLLAPGITDIDGPFLIDDSQDALVARLTGDDIRDVSNTMAAMKFLMVNKTSASLSPEQQALGAALESALVANRIEIEEKVGPNVIGIFDILVKPVVSALAWYTLLGRDDDFADVISADPIVTNGRGTLGVLRALLVLLDGVEITEGQPLGFADTTVNPGDFITFGDEFGPDGDLDNDTFTNICEYRHFKRSSCTVTGTLQPPEAPFVDDTATYVQAVLNPSITPVGCFEVESEEDDCRVTLTGEQVVPPSGTISGGEVRFRRFENTDTGEERFQVNYLHTLESPAPSARFKKGRPGQATDVVLREVAVATPQFWEIYIGATVAATLKTTPNYFEITGMSGDDVPVPLAIRGDNSCGVLAPPPPVPHAADLNGDFIIQDTEILPLIEYINTGGLRCDGAGGFLSGFGDQNCEPHDSDYNPQDWKINLPELLRLVQLFTAGSYEECIGGSEDGYCIVVD